MSVLRGNIIISDGGRYTIHVDKLSTFNIRRDLGIEKIIKNKILESYFHYSLIGALKWF